MLLTELHSQYLHKLTLRPSPLPTKGLKTHLYLLKSEFHWEQGRRSSQTNPPLVHSYKRFIKCKN